MKESKFCFLIDNLENVDKNTLSLNWAELEPKEALKRSGVEFTLWHESHFEEI